MFYSLVFLQILLLLSSFSIIPIISCCKHQCYDFISINAIKFLVTIIININSGIVVKIQLLYGSFIVLCLSELLTFKSFFIISVLLLWFISFKRLQWNYLSCFIPARIDISIFYVNSNFCLQRWINYLLESLQAELKC